MRMLLLAVATLALVGCKGFHAVGPLARQQPIVEQGKPLPSKPRATGKAARVPEVKPTPPTMYIQPDDVNLENPRESAAKLEAELGKDSQAPANAPVTVEVSRIQGRH